jgi:5'-nucleotidase
VSLSFSPPIYSYDHQLTAGIVAYPIDEKLVIAVASSALFDLTASERVFREKGEEEYRQYQRAHEDETLEPGVAFPLVRRLLSLNGADSAEQPVEVILLSRNDPDTGLRVLKSIAAHALPISRAAFVKGKTPFRYLEAFNAALFLSANEEDVRMAVERGAPAGQVLPTEFIDDSAETELRIAFDFDGIIADDSAEAIFKSSGLAAFHASEAQAASVPMPAGPLSKFFREVAKLQQRELTRRAADPRYEPRLRLAIITARNAPAHERVVTTLREWGMQIDEVFFLGGVEKARILREFRPHIFFEDQLSHLETASKLFPCVHVPFGVANVAQAADVMVEAIQENERRQQNSATRTHMVEAAIEGGARAD